MSRAKSENKHEVTWIILLSSFVLGLILCQTVCGQQSSDLSSDPTAAKQAADPSPLKMEETYSKRLLASPIQADDDELTLPSFNPSAGFGNGPAIGSGIAEIVINAEEPLTSSAHIVPQRTPLRPIKAESIPQAVPGELPAAVQIQETLKADQPSGFNTRQRGAFAPGEVVPQPLAYGMIYDPERPINPWNPHTRKDEIVLNGGDQGKPATVDSAWDLYDVNPQDTIGHFDTLDGRRLVTSSNEVAIYAPRFAAVRKLGGVVKSEARLKVGSMDEKQVLQRSEGKDFSSTTKQHESLDRFQAAKRASGFRENLRGVTGDNVIHLQGARNSFDAFENLSLFRLGMHQKAEGARLGLGMQSANVWQDNLGVQVNVKGAQPVIVNDVYKVQQIVRIDSDDKQAVLRVCKVASKISARPGEPVDFSIRFDNLTGREIGNVTIVDNLVGRLEYVADSAECSVKADFSFETNEVGSLVLRWEITDPLPANTGGIIRFRCRVR